MLLNNVDVKAMLRVTNTDPATGDEVYDKVLDVTTKGTFILTSNFFDTILFSFFNGALFGENIQNDVAISDVLLGVGDGATTAFNGTQTPVPVKENSVSIEYVIGGTTYTATDDGSGNITGTDITSGSIDYTTGAYSITFSTAPDTGTNILLDYTNGISADDSLLTGFTFKLATDVDPGLGDAQFGNFLPLIVTPVKLDRYEREDSVVYKAVMSASYTGATATDKVTGLGLYYDGVAGSSTGTTAVSKQILKSTTLNSTNLYGTNGLMLTNASAIELTLYFTVT